MPHPYTRSRFYFMQGLMWLLLGATVLLALWASSYRRNALAVKLSAARHKVVRALGELAAE